MKKGRCGSESGFGQRRKDKGCRGILGRGRNERNME